MRTLTRRLIVLAAMAAPLAAQGSASAQGQPQGSQQSWPAGTSKFVVVPVVEPADAAAWEDHLAQAAEVLLPLQKEGQRESVSSRP